MIGLILSGGASAGTLVSMWLLSSRRRAGWYVSLANQVVWVALMINLEAWGLAPLNVAMTFVAIRGLRNWKE